MAVNFSYIEDACGCLIGYSLPLMTEDNKLIVNYPVKIYNVNDVYIDDATTPSEVVSTWNSDSDNNPFGTLSLGNSAYSFTLSYVSGVLPPSKVIGSIISSFDDSFDESFI